MEDIIALFKLDGDFVDETELNEDLDFLRNLLNILEFKDIFNHQILIEKEILLFFSEELPKFKPFFEKLNMKNIDANLKELIKIKEDYKKDIKSIDSKNKIDNSDDQNKYENNSISPHNSSNTINNICTDGKQDNKNISKNKSNNSINNSSNSLNYYKNYLNYNISDDNNKSKAKKEDSINSINNIKKTQTNKNKDSSSLNDNSNKITDKKKDRKNKINEKNDKEMDMYDIGIDQNDFKLENDEKLVYGHIYPDINIGGKLFEADILNFIYDIFNILTAGKINMLRNKKYYSETNKEKYEYEFDFQIIDLDFIDFLNFINLIYPNISTLDTLQFDIKEIFKEPNQTLNKINSFQFTKELNQYKKIDIIGELTKVYYNQKNAINEQIKRLSDLLKAFDENPEINEKYNFKKENKKVVLIFTYVKYKDFYDNFKENLDKNQIYENIKNYNYLFIFIRDKHDNDRVFEEKIKYRYSIDI